MVRQRYKTIGEPPGHDISDFQTIQKFKRPAEIQLLRNQLNSRIKKAKSARHKNILNENVNNPKKFWSTIVRQYFLVNPYQKLTVNQTPVLLKTFSVVFSVKWPSIGKKKCHLSQTLSGDPIQNLF